MTTTATYTVVGMPCGPCVSSVSEEVGAIRGVEQVAVDLEAAAGGGGRGMRIVRTEEELAGNLETAQAEALAERLADIELDAEIRDRGWAVVKVRRRATRSSTIGNTWLRPASSRCRCSRPVRKGSSAASCNAATTRGCACPRSGAARSESASGRPSCPARMGGSP